MIENDKQLELTQKWIARFKEVKKYLIETKGEFSDRPLLYKAHLESVQSTIEELEENVKEFLGRS